MAQAARLVVAASFVVAFVVACDAVAPTPVPTASPIPIAAVHFRNLTSNALLVRIQQGKTTWADVLAACGGETALVAPSPAATRDPLTTAVQFDPTGKLDDQLLPAGGDTRSLATSYLKPGHHLVALWTKGTHRSLDAAALGDDPL